MRVGGKREKRLVNGETYATNGSGENWIFFAVETDAISCCENDK